MKGLFKFTCGKDSEKATHPPELRLKNRPICTEFQVNNAPIWGARPVSLNNQVPPAWVKVVNKDPKEKGLKLSVLIFWVFLHDPNDPSDQMWIRLYYIQRAIATQVILRVELLFKRKVLRN